MKCGKGDVLAGRGLGWWWSLASILPLSRPGAGQHDNTTSSDVFEGSSRIVVTNQAMGARCAVTADFDGDGKLDIVAASSFDNAVSWFKNMGRNQDGELEFSIKKQITWSSLGSRIVTVADIDGDGDVDVVGASYYDSSLRWMENDGTGVFTSHLISSAVREGQGVFVADLDKDGIPDVASASSGDNTIAVFKQIEKGVFCEIKEVVDDNAVGARTVIASDLNGDGWLDLASASKDDDTVAWYPNDGTGHFLEKVIISRGEESKGAYSLIAVDIDMDGFQDLLVASNGNNAVTLWRNDGEGNFTRTLIFDKADFVLSVTAADFDGDGDIDAASASFYDGHINWYENLDGEGYEWKNHTIYVGIQGHYVSHGDLDGDGDDDLIAVDHAENTVSVYLAKTKCGTSNSTSAASMECCHVGTEWDGTACNPCEFGTYGVGHGVTAQCIECPTDSCIIPGWTVLPVTCSGITSCADAAYSLEQCSCPADTVLDSSSDACSPCPEGQERPDISAERGLDTLGNYSLWEAQQGTCETVAASASGGINLGLVVGVVVAIFVVLLGLLLLYLRKHQRTIKEQEATIQRHSTALERKEAELEVFRVGKSKFGDAVAVVDELLEPESPVSVEQAEKLILVKQCLLQTDNKTMHIPRNLDRKFILQNFGGVNLSEKSLHALSTLGSDDDDDSDSADGDIISSGAPLYCLPEFVKLDVSQKRAIIRLLTPDKLKRWDFNVFEVSDIVRENTLLFVSWAILGSPYAQYSMAEELGRTDVDSSWTLVGDIEGYKFTDSDLKIPIETLCDYVRAIEKDYKAENPYHNAIHAADVVQTLHSLLGMTDKSLIDEDELFSILLAAVVHDVKHPGVNNTFEVNTYSELALLHNDVSVLESEHASHAFTVMINPDRIPTMEPDLHFLRHLHASKFHEIRKKVIDSVLHTDMSKHFSTVATMKNQVGSKRWHTIDTKLRWDVLMLMLHLADISNPAKGDPMSMLWTDRCLEEFFSQGDQERSMGLHVSPNCDRNTTKKPDSQIGFINFVVKPAYELLADIIPKVGEEVLPVIKGNLDYWEEQKELEEYSTEPRMPNQKSKIEVVKEELVKQKSRLIP